MARYDVFLNPSGSGFLLDVQADLLDHLKTRVVVPLYPLGTTPEPVRRLNPVVLVEQERFVMATHLLSVVSVTALTQCQGNLGSHHDEIVAALDMLFQGF